jgi:hypothetical protein
VLTATQISDKWLTNFGASTTSMTNGVNATTEAPGLKAAAAVQLWMQRLQASQGKWVARTSAVSLQQWKSAMIDLGIPRAQQGAQAKQNNYTTFITSYMQFLSGAVSTVRGMPKGSLAQSIARSSAMITASYNWGQSRV